MNSLTSCACKDVSRKFAAVWMFIICIVNMINTGTTYSINSSSCGETFNMENYKKLEVTHDGSDILDVNPCYVEFTKSSDANKKYLCIYGDTIELDCDTSLEYHEAFVKNYIPPEVKMSCDTSSIKSGEWCPSQYQDNVFIVIRKSLQLTSDNIKLRVYLKDVPGEDSPSLSTVVIISIISSSVLVLCSCCGCIIKFCLRDSKPNTPVQYETTAGNVDLQAGQASTNPYPDSGFNGTTAPVYQPVQSGFPGNYNVHPMQTAYPAQQGAVPVK